MGIECPTSNTHALQRAWPLSGCLASPSLLQEGGDQGARPNFPSAFPVLSALAGALGSTSWPAPRQQRASESGPPVGSPSSPSSRSVPHASHTVTPQGLPKPVRQVHLGASHFSDKLKRVTDPGSARGHWLSCLLALPNLRFWDDNIPGPGVPLWG